jgi:predicted branched-subunit amino acid permease
MRSSGTFGAGFVDMLPLWAGAIPIGFAYGVAARTSGLEPLAAQIMSATVFSAAAQLSTLPLLEADAPLLLILITALALNLQVVLVGLAAGRQLYLTWPRRVVLAAFLTDGAYAVSMGRGPLTYARLLGAGASMFVAWNAGSALGLVAGQAIPDPRGLGLDVVVPLTFLAVLVPLVRTRAALEVALVAAGLTILFLRVAPSGLAVLGAGALACAVGAVRGPSAA